MGDESVEDPGPIPNAETQAAMREAEAGAGRAFDTIEELFIELNAD
jgi:hypothetical protein